MTPSRILLRAPNWLGDCVMSLPTIAALANTFPDATIAVGVRPHLAACYEACPDIDNIIPCPPGGQGIGGFLRHWREGASLREHRFDCGILLTNSFSSALWMWRSGTNRRIGFSRDGRGVFLTDPMRVTPAIAAAHQGEYYLHLARHAGAQGELQMPRFNIPERGREAAQAILQKSGIGDQPYCLCAPVSAYGTVKDWAPERFAEVLSRLAAHYRMPALITGVTADHERNQRIAEAAGTDAHNVSGATDLAGFLGLVERAALFLGNDSGGAHAAAACGIATAVIFGITEPSRTRPLGTAVRIVGKGGACTPDLRNPAVQQAAREALAAITTDEVWSAIGEIYPPQAKEGDADA